MAKRHRRGRRAGQQGREQTHDMFAGLDHIHMRIGLEADDHVAMVQHGLGDIAMQVQRHADGHARCRRPDPTQQLALAIVMAAGDHGAVQVQQDAVAAASDRRHDGLRHGLEGLVLDRPRGHGMGQHRHLDPGVDAAGKGVECADRRRIAVGGGQRLGAHFRAERGQRRPHRRKAVGLVIEAGKDEPGHAASVFSAPVFPAPVLWVSAFRAGIFRASAMRRS